MKGANMDPFERLLHDISTFSLAGPRPLRDYQAECARAVVRSVLRGDGRIFTIMFACSKSIRFAGSDNYTCRLTEHIARITVMGDAAVVSVDLPPFGAA